MTNTQVNIITIMAVAAVIVDLIFEINKVLKRRSSMDISPIGITIRTMAMSALIIKFISINDHVLIFGQIALASAMFVYLFLVLKYRHPARRSRKASRKSA